MPGTEERLKDRTYVFHRTGPTPASGASPPYFRPWLGSQCGQDPRQPAELVHPIFGPGSGLSAKPFQPNGQFIQPDRQTWLWRAGVSGEAKGQDPRQPPQQQPYLSQQSQSTQSSGPALENDFQEGLKDRTHDRTHASQQSQSTQSSGPALENDVQEGLKDRTHDRTHTSQQSQSTQSSGPALENDFQEGLKDRTHDRTHASQQSQSTQSSGPALENNVQKGLKDRTHVSHLNSNLIIDKDRTHASQQSKSTRLTDPMPGTEERLKDRTYVFHRTGPTPASGASPPYFRPWLGSQCGQDPRQPAELVHPIFGPGSGLSAKPFQPNGQFVQPDRQTWLWRAGVSGEAKGQDPRQPPQQQPYLSQQSQSTQSSGPALENDFQEGLKDRTHDRTHTSQQSQSTQSSGPALENDFQEGLKDRTHDRTHASQQSQSTQSSGPALENDVQEGLKDRTHDRTHTSQQSQSTQSSGPALENDFQEGLKDRTHDRTHASQQSQSTQSSGPALENNVQKGLKDRTHVSHLNSNLIIDKNRTNARQQTQSTRSSGPAPEKRGLRRGCRTGPMPATRQGPMPATRQGPMPATRQGPNHRIGQDPRQPAELVHPIFGPGSGLSADRTHASQQSQSTQSSGPALENDVQEGLKDRTHVSHWNSNPILD
ncbi:Hypothetical predicted protein [Xyrichtys novacula]|uniref:Uncharacterized protein n=1 Tax=Xyrichtys novacula TaxID=13765 RepID=A0AAV1HDP3_XYRNO|nr:Hypothetical predicted protein [Xyrichtys novacula]